MHVSSCLSKRPHRNYDHQTTDGALYVKVAGSWRFRSNGGAQEEVSNSITSIFSSTRCFSATDHRRWLRTYNNASATNFVAPRYRAGGVPHQDDGAESISLDINPAGYWKTSKFWKDHLLRAIYDREGNAGVIIITTNEVKRVRTVTFSISQDCRFCLKPLRS